MKNPVKLLHSLYLAVRYTLPIWIDQHTHPPFFRSIQYRWLSRTHRARVKLIQRQYEIAFGKTLDLEAPRTLNGKIQWLKLFRPDPLITLCADKYRVREYVREKIGEQYLPKLLGVWKRPEEIDFAKLPEQFVLKVNWGSGQNLICRDKKTVSERGYRKTLRRWLRPFANQYYLALEWGYRDIPPRIICEEYLTFLEQDPKTFKIFCFNGEPRVVQLVMDDKTQQETINYYDSQWNLLPFRQNFPNNPAKIPCPVFWEQMLELARKLSSPFPFVRTDFFESPDGVLFSELTFYSDAGLARFEPEEWDEKLGEMLELPEPMAEKTK